MSLSTEDLSKLCNVMEKMPGNISFPISKHYLIYNELDPHDLRITWSPAIAELLVEDMDYASVIELADNDTTFILIVPEPA